MNVLARVNGVPIYGTRALTIIVEDWSHVRSPARARRRRRKYPQAIRYVERPDPKVYKGPHGLFAHPDTVKALGDQLEREGFIR